MSSTPPSFPNLDAVTASPSATGPAGPLFEAQVGAYYLLSMLAGGEPRGLPGTSVSQVEFQRALERPLDDVIVEATDGQGQQAILEIQVKRTIDFTASDCVFDALVKQVANAAGKPEFDTQHYELAVAVERTSTKIERSYQEVLSWAREFGTPETFFARLNRPGLANRDMRKFVENFRAKLKSNSAPNDDPALWRILRRFRILVFDFNQEGSATEALVRERCRMLLAPEQAASANALWLTLAALTIDSAAKGGEKTRAQLRDTLASEYHYHLAGDRQLTNARAAVHEASIGALQDIATKIGSIEIDRAEHLAHIHAALDKGRYVEIRGGPGVGKSGLLRHLAEQVALEARVIVLSPARTIPHGWVSFQTALGCRASAQEFLADLASDGGVALFIDGLDFFRDEDKKTTVRDLVRAAANVPNLSVIATARNGFGKDDPSWLPQGALDALGRGPTVQINELNQDEIQQLSDADPSLALLLADNHPARQVTRNLFRLARLVNRVANTPVPVTEAAMAQQWWQSADGGETGRRERKRVLLTLAEQSLNSSGPFDTRPEPHEAVGFLIQSEALRELKTEQVVFSHDVLHDWAVGCLIHDRREFIEQLPLTSRAPNSLVRGMELAAHLSIETSPDDRQWAALLERLSEPGVHGSWRRAVLLALVRSEVGPPVLERASPSLLRDKGKLLNELLRVTFAVDSEPASQIYSAVGISLSSLPADFFVPAAPSWLRLVVWTHSRMKDLPPEVIPDLAEFYARWSMAFFGQDALTPLLLAHLYEWLIEVEAALHPESYADLRRPFGVTTSLGNEAEFEKSLRLNFLAFCWRVPDLAERYLRSVIARRPGHQIADEIMKFRGTAAQAAPAALADLTLRTLLPAQPRNEFQTSTLRHGPFDIGDSSYFPASPNQGSFLDLLRHSTEHGLRVVRGLIAHAAAFYFEKRDPGNNTIIVRFPAGERTFTWQNCYNWSRSSNSSIATSALMALEAWGHKRIEDGIPAEIVLTDILGTGVVPTAYLLVAVDLLIAHWPKTAATVIPFLASPDLLSLDRERYAHDTTPNLLPTSDEPTGTSSTKSLQERPSRRFSLDMLIGLYVQFNSPLLPQLQAALAESAAHVGSPGEGEDTMRSGRFAAFHAVNLANPSNWKRVQIDRGDGTPVPALQYQIPAAEADLTAPGHEQFARRSAETDIRFSLSLALDDRSKSTSELLERAVVWAKVLDLKTISVQTEANIFQREDWRIKARITAAALLLRDGDETIRAQHQSWAQGVLKEALAANDDPHGSHPFLAYNNVAIATVGLISAVRRSPAEEGFRSLLEIASRDDDAMLPAFGAELSTLHGIDPRLPRSLMRIGFASCVHARHDYQQSEKENRSRRQVHRQRIQAAIEQEITWLKGTAREPEWPAFPNDPPPRRQSWNRPTALQQWEEEQAQSHDSVSSGEATKWIETAKPLVGPKTIGWFRALINAYAEWTSVANGAEQGDEVEIGTHHLQWNNSYFDLAARTFVGLSMEQIEAGVLRRVFTFPEDSFCETTAVLLRTCDGLHFNDGVLAGPDLLHLRNRVIEHIRQTRGWQRVVERKSDSMASHLARAVSTLYFHNGPWGGSDCYLYPPAAAKLRIFLPLLSQVASETANSQYIAFEFLNLIGLKVETDNLPYLTMAANSWIASYPNDTSFWVERGVGKRICTWISDAMNENPVAFSQPSCPSAEIDALLDHLLRLGVASAHQVEQTFSRLRAASS